MPTKIANVAAPAALIVWSLMPANAISSVKTQKQYLKPCPNGLPTPTLYKKNRQKVQVLLLVHLDTTKFDLKPPRSLA